MGLPSAYTTLNFNQKFIEPGDYKVTLTSIGWVLYYNGSQNDYGVAI